MDADEGGLEVATGEGEVGSTGSDLLAPGAVTVVGSKVGVRVGKNKG